MRAYGKGGVMEITEVRVFPVEEDKLRGYVMLTFDNCFVIRDMKIIQGTDGYFVSMPSKKMKDGTYKDIAHPIDKQTRTMIESRILDEYHKTVAARGISPNMPRFHAL
jgi:stage V sporulation protein G